MIGSGGVRQAWGSILVFYGRAREWPALLVGRPTAIMMGRVQSADVEPDGGVIVAAIQAGIESVDPEV